MSGTQRLSRAVLVVGLAACTVVLPAAAGAADELTPHGNKAQVEYSERQLEPPSQVPKAQIEHDEISGAGQSGPLTAPTSETTSVGGLDGSAAAWQLALAAGVGAVATGAVVAGARQVRRHHSAVA
jgi:hypothetical protein